MALTLEIVRDEYATDPRKEYEHVGRMVCAHRRYHLGDEQLDTGLFDSWEAVEESLYEQGAIVVLPLYLYDHSGLAMSISPFGCRWDSGQVGFIYATREAVEGAALSESAITERVTDLLKAEVQEYTAFLEGEVFAYLVKEDGEVLDACFGYYDKTEATREGEAALAHYEDKARALVAEYERGINQDG